MGRKLKGRCPCGYSFEILGDICEAISVVRRHVDSFHKDFLPFGITNDEALELLNQGINRKSPQIQGLFSAYKVRS